MKTTLICIDKDKEIEIPGFFNSRIREDIVLKVYESLKKMQAYSVHYLAGKLSAPGKQSHRRRKWKTLYGQGVSRVPRKFFSKRGTLFAWEGTFIPGTRGGRSAHPPLGLRRERKINKNESLIAFKSALAATASKKYFEEKYSKLRLNEKVKLPIIIESPILEKEPKQIIKILQDKLGIEIKKKTKLRAGKGKMRSRKHISKYSLLLVVDKNNKKLNNYGIEVVKADNLGLSQIANGGKMGRLTVYTDKSLEQIENKLDKTNKKIVENKK